MPDDVLVVTHRRDAAGEWVAVSDHYEWRRPLVVGDRVRIVGPVLGGVDLRGRVGVLGASLDSPGDYWSLVLDRSAGAITVRGSSLILCGDDDGDEWDESGPVFSCVTCGATDLDSLLVIDDDDDGRHVCESCSVGCEWCGHVMLPGSEFVTGHGWSVATLCASCSASAYSCDRCDVTYNTETQGARMHVGYGEYRNVCEACSERYAYCTGCEYDRSNVCGDCERCEECGCDCECDDSRALHAWDYKPRPVFHAHDHAPGPYENVPGRAYFGLEVETENRGGDAMSDLVGLVSDHLGGLAYCKHDGSLHSGLEVVTHPMTREYFANLSGFDSLVRSLAEHGARSWNSHRCGFHVHVSRAGFVSRSHLFAFSLFWYRNRDAIHRISGRRSDEMERWSSLSAHQGDHDGAYPPLIGKVMGTHTSTRYAAVNLTNPHTVEVRVFRCSLRPDTLRGYFDLVDAVHQYTAAITSHEIRAGLLSWDAFLRAADATEFPYLHALNMKRGN